MIWLRKPWVDRSVNVYCGIMPQPSCAVLRRTDMKML